MAEQAPGLDLPSGGESGQGIGAGTPVAHTSTPDRSAAVRDHLANERTLLAWQRTALALVGLGFVVDRFAFEGETDKAVLGTVVGLGMIVAGGLAAVVGVSRFVKVEREIDTASYRPAVGVHLVFAAAIVLAALAMVLYMVAAKPG